MPAYMLYLKKKREIPLLLWSYFSLLELTLISIIRIILHCPLGWTLCIVKIPVEAHGGTPLRSLYHWICGKEHSCWQPPGCCALKSILMFTQRLSFHQAVPIKTWNAEGTSNFVGHCELGHSSPMWDFSARHLLVKDCLMTFVRFL
jgi:hypothetical protein